MLFQIQAKYYGGFEHRNPGPTAGVKRATRQLEQSLDDPEGCQSLAHYAKSVVTSSVTESKALLLNLYSTNLILITALLNIFRDHIIIPESRGYLNFH